MDLLLTVPNPQRQPIGTHVHWSIACHHERRSVTVQPEAEGDWFRHAQYGQWSQPDINAISINIDSFLTDSDISEFFCENKIIWNTTWEKTQNQYLSIWFNADPGIVMGGRSVEAGEGPNYYTTVGDLRKAIAAGIQTLDG